ncbi:Putative integral membrane protein, putative [Fulvivirga imtechensis AK7]|uniref:Putative integral membrane protein, putative n=1 Tax=Fulvivirga imtechensis AK7 TaxID=1237149 RepID=L8K1B3_9BACT|nr:hypothetical protein [Fulvivirga imtechensis]ELR73709.1 Putative integral membrane protein, putative [Fulvivirga imtechensis AK7]
MIRNSYWWIFFCIVACGASSDKVGGSAKFHAAELRGEVENPLINEASGLVEGYNNPGYLWTHNDSGDEARIFLLDEFGRDNGIFTLKGIANRDWEDISSGPGPEEGANYLYIAEMGDNLAVHDYKYIYRFIEPRADDPRVIERFDTLTFQYPDGKRDAECLMVDPLTGDIYIISKREAQVGVYKAPFPQPVKDTIILEKLGNIPYHNVVGGDISSDGREILVKTYDKVLYWERDLSLSLMETLRTAPLEIPYIVEPQGEAIAWKKDGSGFFTLSEERDSIEAILYFYPKNL